jgi:hypothetical protein
MQAWVPTGSKDLSQPLLRFITKKVTLQAKVATQRVTRAAFEPHFSVREANYYLGSPSDPRRQGPLYVEARGSLQPAVDFFARAVRAADANGTTTGELLASVNVKTLLYIHCTNKFQAAESQMSLGNVTAPPGDERHFSHAIRYLRRAEATPGYTLSVYMQQYLNDYGRYVS